MNFTKFLRTRFCIEQLRWLLLTAQNMKCAFKELFSKCYQLSTCSFTSTEENFGRKVSFCTTYVIFRWKKKNRLYTITFNTILQFFYLLIFSKHGYNNCSILNCKVSKLWQWKTEAVVQRCSVKNVCNFIKKETLAQLLSCEFRQISKNTSFWWNTSGGCFWKNYLLVGKGFAMFKAIKS